MPDSDYLDPGIDAETKKLIFRSVTAHNDGTGRTDIAVRDTPGMVTDEPVSRGGTNSAPTPIETVIGALCGCDAVITGVCAGAMHFKYGGIDYAAEARIDQRGLKGVVGIRPYFEKLSVKKMITTDEPPERIEKLKKNIDRRCPVANLIRAAGVELTIEWVIEPSATADDG